MKPRSSSKSRVVLFVGMAAVFLFLFAFIAVSWSQVSAQAPIETISPYLSVIHSTDSNGKALTGFNINGPSTPPPGFESERAPVLVITEGGKLLTAPAFTWVFGCSSVSGAMIAGYYDRNSYPNMYAGPTKGGLMPLTDGSWAHWSDGYTTYPNNPLIASHKGSDGRTIKGSIDDYWIKYGSSLPDPYITGKWTQHAWGTAIGDYMKTSQSYYKSTDGSTWFWNYNDATKLTCTAMTTFDSGMGFGKISDFDGTYGRKLFYQARGYTVTDCYSQNTDTNVSGGFSLASFRAQIDAGHPVFLNLDGHSIVGVGYASAPSTTVYVHDTWDTSTHTLNWVWDTEYSGMKLLSVSIVNLKPGTVPSQIVPDGKITTAKPTFTWSKVAGATKYQFKVYQGATLKYTALAGWITCGTSTCSYTPNVTLASGTYKWEIQAYVGGVYKAYSTFMTFTR